MRERLRHVRPDDGLSLIEVVVAMMIFALVSTSVVYGMLQVLNLTRDSRARLVAANLAAEEVDLARDVADLFSLADAERTVTLNGDRFTVRRATEWVSDPTTDISCGSSGTGLLRYKRVNVAVTWDRMRGTQAVRADTVLNPIDKVNDPTKGTIRVSVFGVGGTARAGVQVTATPSTSTSPNAATALSRAPSATDADGCSYILRVNPGTYDVTVSRAGYADTAQVLGSSTRTVSVAQGASTSVGFEFDAQATVDLRYGAGYTPATGETVWTPRGLTTSFVTTYTTSGVVERAAAVPHAPRQTAALYPFPSGYQVFAGACPAADPAAWPELSEGGNTWVGRRTAGVAAAPGATVAADVGTGVVSVHLGPETPGSPRFLEAVATTSGAVPDQPACSATHSFGTVSQPIPASGDVTLLLPYGSWTLRWGTVGTAAANPVPVEQLTLPATPAPVRSSLSAPATVTFDPRVTP